MYDGSSTSCSNKACLPLQCVRCFFVERSLEPSFVTFFPVVGVKKKVSVAFSLSTLRNMMCCVRFQGT